jgi:hypothetical protein
MITKTVGVLTTSSEAGTAPWSATEGMVAVIDTNHEAM